MQTLLLVLVLLGKAAAAVQVSVMLPLDVVGAGGIVQEESSLVADLRALRAAGVDGVAADVWWGLVEHSPGVYNWAGYERLVELVANAGLKLQPVMSFHGCGGNVGDSCNIPLPTWVRAASLENGGFYTDREGWTDPEYLSLGVDSQPIFAASCNGCAPRTAQTLYFEFMASFAERFSPHLRSGLIDEVQVGMGPAGELRYPSYQLGRWHWCGIGEFQSYDRWMRASLLVASQNAGHPEWGVSGPATAGSYCSLPNDTEFFTSGFQRPYGKFFLSWYSSELVQHGNAMLSAAHAAFGAGVRLAGKVSGVHWHHGHPSHAAELTAGYYDGYSQIAAMFARWNATLDFTCLEMRNDPTGECKSMPEDLVGQLARAADSASVRLSGENAVCFIHPIIIILLLTFP